MKAHQKCIFDDAFQKQKVVLVKISQVLLYVMIVYNEIQFYDYVLKLYLIFSRREVMKM